MGNLKSKVNPVDSLTPIRHTILIKNLSFLLNILNTIAQLFYLEITKYNTKEALKINVLQLDITKPE